MNRQAQIINDRYEAMMFAKTSQAAKQAARQLVQLILGEEALARPLDETLRECCRRIRPATDPREQARFESEFLELGLWPSDSRWMAA